jgi:hypothetical protein
MDSIREETISLPMQSVIASVVDLYRLRAALEEVQHGNRRLVDLVCSAATLELEMPRLPSHLSHPSSGASCESTPSSPPSPLSLASPSSSPPLSPLSNTIASSSRSPEMKPRARALRSDSWNLAEFHDASDESPFSPTVSSSSATRITSSVGNLGAHNENMCEPTPLALGPDRISQANGDVSASSPPLTLPALRAAVREERQILAHLQTRVKYSALRAAGFRVPIPPRQPTITPAGAGGQFSASAAASRPHCADGSDLEALVGDRCFFATEAHARVVEARRALASFIAAPKVCEKA